MCCSEVGDLKDINSFRALFSRGRSCTVKLHLQAPQQAVKCLGLQNNLFIGVFYLRQCQSHGNELLEQIVVDPVQKKRDKE
jgi:hypothetical protein